MVTAYAIFETEEGKYKVGYFHNGHPRYHVLTERGLVSFIRGNPSQKILYDHTPTLVEIVKRAQQPTRKQRPEQ